MVLGFVLRIVDPGGYRRFESAADPVIYSFILIPVTVGIAVLKYRLYDIDRIIN